MSGESAESLIKLANEKNPEAAYKVAIGLIKGKYGLKRSPDKAPKFFKIAADSGNVDAINRYADIQMQDKKYDEAIKYYQLGIKKKSPYSMIAYGKYLQDIEHNDEKSTKCFKLASDLNDPEGMYYYASYLFQQTKNDEAKQLLRKSADLGYYESLHFLSVILKEEEDKTEISEQEINDTEPESEIIEEEYRAKKKEHQRIELEEKKREADENDAEAMLWLVDKYEKEPLRKNRLQALPYYKKLAKLKDVESIRHLQLMYKYGRDVDMDIKEYFKYTKMLADAGEVDSMLKVSELFKDGEGCEANEELSKKYKEKAAEGSIKQTKLKLSELQKSRQARKAKNNPIQPNEKEYENTVLSDAFKLSLQLINGEVYLPDFQKGFSILQIVANFQYPEALNEVLNYLLRSEQLASNPNEEDIVKYLKLKKDDVYVLDLAHLFLNGSLEKLALKQDGAVINYFKQFAIDRKDEKLLFKFANGYKNGKPPLDQNTSEYIKILKVLAQNENQEAIDKLRLISEKEGINTTTTTNNSNNTNTNNSDNQQPNTNSNQENDKNKTPKKLSDLRRLKERADSNNGNNEFAMINYAKILIEGKGLEKPDYEEGIKYLTKAALQCNNSTAMFELGEIYENGKIVKRDLKEAVKFFALGDKNGNHQCAFNLVKCLLLANKGAEAKNVIKKSGDQDFSDKLFNKLLYEWKYEPDEVARLLKLAADAGDVGSMKILSRYLIRGRNVTHNPDEAQIYLNMYKKATNQ